MAIYKSLLNFFGFESDRVSNTEILVSTLGSVAGITLVAYISFQITGAQGASLIVPSMGASAVLLFAVPHGRLSQPWSLIGGHLVSAVIGVSVYHLVPDIYLASGLAVGLAIGAMHILGCIHPPGGATALAAIIGGPAIHALGYQYVMAPILLNVTVILVVAITFNNAFPWRRYPANLMRFSEAPAINTARAEHVIDKKHIEQAITDMDLVVDVTSDDLQRLFILSQEHADRLRMTPDGIQLGRYYTNGRHGIEWSVRQIIDEAGHAEPAKNMVIYRVVEGHGLHSASSCTRREFANWAARELKPNS
ncbi:MAG TPA: HPP family protein [Gammaproteobacteria bacterium]|nr:HPP family protein [Gammaproteobacteria bacterium]